MKIRINTEAKFRWKLLMEGEEVDWAYYDLIVEITKPSHSKEIIDMTIDGSTLVFNYKPNQCGQYIATAYLNRYKPDEAALDVKIFEGVRWSWCADNDDDEITTFNLSGNISYGSVNLNNYYTKQEIDEKLEDIAVGDVDLTNYATKEWVGNKYQPKGNYQPAGNYLTSIPSEYVTENELEIRLEKIDIPTTDLSDYYTKSEVDDKIDNIAVGDVDLTGYATEVWTTANYQPKGDYQPAGNYLTSIPSEYVTETELEEAINNIDIPSVDLTGYATENWVTANYQPKGDYQPAGNYLTSIPTEYVTETELEEAINNIDIPSVDLTGYATEQWVTSNYQPKGDYQPAGNYLTSVPDEYVTETELSNKGYLTSIPAEYVTEDELNTKGYLTAVPEEYVTEEELSGKGYLTSIPAEYVTESELETRLEGISSGSGTSDTIPTLTINIENGNYNNISLVPTIFARLESDKPCHIVVYLPANTNDDTLKNSYVNVTNYQIMTVQSYHDALTIWVDIIGDGYYMVQIFKDTSKYTTAFISKHSESWTTSITSLETRVKALEDALNQ